MCLFCSVIKNPPQLHSSRYKSIVLIGREAIEFITNVDDEKGIIYQQQNQGTSSLSYNWF